MTQDRDSIGNVLTGIKVPPQPQILVDIYMEQAMPNPDFSRIAELIARDPGLSAGVLKLVNSDFYGLTSKITSIEKAAHLLGLDQLVNIVNGLSIKNYLRDDQIAAMNIFWDSATDVANCAATIAKRVGFQSPDLAYNLGLFHNCGMALLFRSHPAYFSTVEQAYAETEQRVIDVENSTLKTNHAVIGYYAARSWNLPKPVCEVIAEHHNAVSIFTSSYHQNYDPFKKTLLSILKMAEHICKLYSVLGQQKKDYEWEKISNTLFDYVGISQIDFDGLSDLVLEMGISCVYSDGS
jgi:HD-like signal output (HDOD) protein